MTVRAAVTGLVIFLLSVPVVQSQNGWGVTYSQTEVCALEGSTVELSCTYTYPYPGYYRVTESFWFTKTQNNEPVDVRTDSQYTGRVTYSCGWKRCTLRITNVEKRDSATYKFRFITNQAGVRFTGNPGVILSVTDLQVQGTYSWSKLELKCLSRCLSPHHVSYVWYKNGHKISAEESSYSDSYVHADSYSCALKGYEDFPSPLYCYYDSSCNKVKYTHRTICASRGSSVDISCSYRSYESIRSKFWFRSDQSQQGQHDLRPKDLREDSQYVNRVQVTESWRDTTLRISELRESDSAVYRFTFTAGSSGWGTSLPGTTLTVTALQVQVMKITTHRFYTEAELRCYSSCSEADLSYVWFRNGQKVTWKRTATTKISYYLDNKISCALEGHERFPSPSVYSPKVPSVVLNPTGEIVESSSVTLTCSTDANPAANITWFKRNGRQDFEPFSSEQQLIFSSIQSSDAGEYRCRAENSLGRRTSAHIIIDVKYAPRLPSVSLSPVDEIMGGSSVNLTCSSVANPAAKYTWYKENQTAPQGLQGLYGFTTISPEDRGTYYCRSENQYGWINSSPVFIDVQYAPKLPSVSVSPVDEIMEGSSVTLTCSSDANPAAKYTWYKENQTLPQGQKGTYSFTTIRSKDSGMYSCKSENKYGHKTSKGFCIDVQYAPRRPSVSLSPSAAIVEGTSLNLTCSSDANPAAKYTWYKENQTLPQGQKGTYSFTTIRSKDSGMYSCKSENKYGHKTSKGFSVDVQYTPRLPSVSLSPSAAIVEGTSLNLTCSSDANPAANYTWYKVNEETSVASGQIFIISDIRSEHGGNYYCEAHNTRGRHNSTLHLVVVSGSMKSVTAGLVTVIFLVIILLSIFLLIRKKRSSGETNKPGGRLDNEGQLNMASANDDPPASARRQPAEEQGELCYATVSFSRNKEDPIYSNILQAKFNRPKTKNEEEEDEVEYSVVKITSACSLPESRSQEVVEDSSKLYSTVNKKPRA
ncbi:B-cell receptor CD22-like isoform X2 [Cheilinus undulatus]|uniref:B-cell receptor CD22-like isoform X2 n=1 Tax=Cheilinus undulatus TaxID=241271 RepID=UPI001BD3259B|nr:B-cell receptor CD22-like isoform X2 [Cheilinus undulatus]